MTATEGAAREGARRTPGAARCDVVTLGESMVTFRPTRPGRLADVSSFERGIGGAESNVACGLAGAGHSATWVSRVGADGFGQHLVERIAAYGVDTGHVGRDPHRPTGVYFRTAGERALRAADDGAPAADEPRAASEPLAEVVYYRAGSAASAMSVANLPGDVLRCGRILHLTGITAALSPDCRALLHDLTTHPAPASGDPAPRPLLSFDVNYRVGLWRDGDDPGATLLALARRCDLVFVGDDEAAAAWGVTGGPDAVRATLPEPRTLVVKQGASGATVFHRPDPPPPPPARAPSPAPRPAPAPPADDVTFVPALHVDVVAPVGAGDAFAAGFLSATLRGLPVRDRVRHGHLMAAAVLTVPGDLADLTAAGTPDAPGTSRAPADAAREPSSAPDRPSWSAVADPLVALDDTAWAALRLGPGWTATAAAPHAARRPAGQDTARTREADGDGEVRAG